MGKLEIKTVVLLCGVLTLISGCHGLTAYNLQNLDDSGDVPAPKVEGDFIWTE